MKELMKQPSSWLPNGIKLNLSDQFRLFSFTEELQIRLEELLEKIFSFINAKLAS